LRPPTPQSEFLTEQVISKGLFWATRVALSEIIFDTQNRKIGNSKILFPTIFEKAQVNMKTHFVDVKP